MAALAACWANRSAFSDAVSQAASRSAGWNVLNRSPMLSALRKFCCTNSPSVAPNWSLRSEMMAVWGMGRPRGRRNRAVTANQSASPPTMDASAKAWA